jgi:hypothetical protein
MWGFYNKRDKKLANFLFDIFTDFYLSEWYKSRKSRSSDQNLLAYYVWPLASKNATIHDSYYCSKQALAKVSHFQQKEQIIIVMLDILVRAIQTIKQR